jgi:hypothetical protein
MSVETKEVIHKNIRQKLENITDIAVTLNVYLHHIMLLISTDMVFITN